MMISPRPGYSGFSLIELLITLVILAIMLTIALPMFGDFIDRSRLVAATDALYADLQLARSEAIRNNQDVMISFQSGSSWCYGLVISGTACNCSVTDTTSPSYCSLKRTTATDFTNASIANDSNITFTGNQTGFDPVRGTAINTGSVTLQSAKGRQTTVSLALLGRVTVCSTTSSTITDYPAC